MKIELTQAEVELKSARSARRSIHNDHRELWVRVLTAAPVGPGDWEVIKRKVDPEELAGFARKPCAFYSDQWEDDDPERQEYNFEQWWIFPSVESGWT